MDTSTAAVLAFGIGIIAGLRSMTAPAVVSWAAQWKWLDLGQTALSFLSSTIALIVLTAGAIIELVVDKLPKTPRRTEPIGLIARFVTGGLSGAAICAAANQSLLIGGVLGGVGGVIGGFAGYAARSRLVRALKVPDLVVALLEDAVAIGGGLFLVSRL